MRVASPAFLNLVALRTSSCFPSAASKLCFRPSNAQRHRSFRTALNGPDPIPSRLFSTSSPTSTPTMTSTLPTAEKLASESFPATVELARTVLNEAGLSRADLLSALLSTSAGARGLFVSFLADESLPLADLDPADPAMVEAVVNTPGSEIRVLAVKNVVMPLAMVIQYGRTGETDRAAASRLAKDRAERLLVAWVAREDIDANNRSDVIRKAINEMVDALSDRGGPHAAFIRKWAYDDEQKSAMLESLQRIV